MAVEINGQAQKVTLRTLATQAGAALVGFIQSGAGAVKRPAQDKMRDIVSVSDFIRSADGDDISLGIARAASGRPGSIIKLNAGDYTARTVLELGALSDVLIDATGANITVAANITFVRCAAPTFEAIQTITAIDGSDYWGARKTVTCTNGAAYAVGDVVKIVSDDKQACTRLGSGGLDYRRGMYAVIEAISGNDLTIDRPVPWSLTTSPRVGRLPRRRLEWRGGVIGYETGHEANWTGQAFVLYGLTDVSIDVEIEHTYNQAINLVGCFAPIVRARGRDLRNSEADLQFGYLVNDMSQFSSVHVEAGRNRHAYTTNMSDVAAGSTDLHLYGATYASTVTGNCHGNSQAGFDTHHGSDSIVFNGCVSSGGSAGGGQFVLRGQNHRVINPQGFNGKDGIYAFAESGVVEPTTATIVNADIDVDHRPLLVDPNSQVTIDGGRYRSRKYGVAWQIAGTVKLAGHVTITPGGTTEVDSRRAVELSDGTVDARGASVLFDLTAIPGGATNYGLIQSGGSTASSWTGGELRSINDTNLTTAFYKKSGDPATETFTKFQIVTEKLGGDPFINMDITGAAGATLTLWKWRHASGGGGSNYIQKTISASGQTFTWYGRGDEHVAVRLYASTSGNYDLGAVPVGIVLGQALHLSVTTDAGGTLTLKHGAAYNTNLPGGSDLAFSAEQGVTLIWNGSRWVPLHR